MQKSLVFSALFASALAVSALPAAACAGDWPRCYFAGDVGELKETELGALWLVGRHFFPEWTGKAPRGNDITSSEAHAMDFATAAARAGAADPLGDFARYRECADRWIRAVDEHAAWRPPFVPVDAEERAAWPDYAREFYLYSLGRAQLLADSSLSAPPAWEELLALPEADRRERTVWVLHGKVLAAKDFAAADEQLRLFRAACDAGFTDTCGLEAAILRRLLLRDSSLGLRWMPLVLAAYGGVPGNEDWQTPFNVHRMLSVEGAARCAGALAERERALLARLADEYSVWRRASWRDRNRRLQAALSSDPVGREVLFVLDGGLDGPPTDPGTLSTPLLSADRAAWRAFDRGGYDTAKALLAYAPADSLLRLFLEARFARMDRDLPRAAEKLREWLAVFRERGGDEWCDFAILNDDCGDTYGDVTTRPWECVVAGTLGMVLVEQCDFAEALGVFVRDARSWRDAAFVAERCLATEELASLLPALEESMAAAEGGMEHAGHLETLLARRLMRENRPDEAGKWFARAVEEVKKTCEWDPEWRHGRVWYAQEKVLLWEVRQATAKRAYAETDPDKRAAAFLDLARIERSAGMELYATELEPDVAVFAGGCPSSAVPLESREALRAVDWKVVKALPRTRWHWRARAARTARRAAAMAASEGVKAGALLFAGGFPFADEREADEAYRMLSDLPTHPAGAYAREKHWIPEWGGGPVAKWIERDNARTPEEWAAGGWEIAPETLAALADATVPPPAAPGGAE